MDKGKEDSLAVTWVPTSQCFLPSLVDRELHQGQGEVDQKVLGLNGVLDGMCIKQKVLRKG